MEKDGFNTKQVSGKYYIKNETTIYCALYIKINSKRIKH